MKWQGSRSENQIHFETHFHADFVSGHIDLAEKTGAPLFMVQRQKLHTID